jgi:hypothetical protein
MAQNPKYSYSEDDLLQPVYCTVCRQHIPKSVSNEGNGVCPDCIAIENSSEINKPNDGYLFASQLVHCTLCHKYIRNDLFNTGSEICLDCISNHDAKGHQKRIRVFGAVVVFLSLIIFLSWKRYQQQLGLRQLHEIELNQKRQKSQEMQKALEQAQQQVRDQERLSVEQQAVRQAQQKALGRQQAAADQKALEELRLLAEQQSLEKQRILAEQQALEDQKVLAEQEASDQKLAPIIEWVTWRCNKHHKKVRYMRGVKPDYCYFGDNHVSKLSENAKAIQRALMDPCDWQEMKS